MKLVLVLIAVIAFAAAYIIWVRPYLKTLPQLADAWQRQATAWGAIKVWLAGRKTILTGLWGSFIGLFPDLLQVLSGVDLKTALSLPDNWALIVSGILVPILMLIFRAKA
jgi:hypothetical protein